MSIAIDHTSGAGADARAQSVGRRRQRLFRLFGGGSPLLGRDVLATMRLRSVRAGVIVLPLALTTLIVVAAAKSGHAIGNAAERATEILGVSIIAALGIISVIGAVLGAQAVSSERNSGTLDLIQVTGISPWRIIAGKTLAVWVVLAVMSLACLPPLCFCFVIGGISLSHFLLVSALPLLAGFVPLAFGICVGTTLRSARLAVGAAVAGVCAFGPILFSGVWVLMMRVMGFDRFFSHGPFVLPTGDEDPLRLLTGGVLLPAYVIVTASWFFLALSVSSLSTPGSDRAKPLRHWLIGAALLGGVLTGLVVYVEALFAWEPAQLISGLCGILAVGTIALTGHPRPRAKTTRSWARYLPVGPSGDAFFSMVLATSALLIAVIVLIIEEMRWAGWIGPMLMAFIVLLTGVGVLLSASFKPTTARWWLACVAVTVVFLPLAVGAFLSILSVDGQSEAGEFVRLFSPVGIILACHESLIHSPGGLPRTSLFIAASWTITGAIGWSIGALRLRAARRRCQEGRS